MTPPPFWTVACLLFWGWQAGLAPPALPMAAILAGSRWAQRRWAFDLSDFSRISDACTLIVVGMAIWLLATEEATRVVFILLRWLPIAYFPILAAQVYGAGPGVDLRALSLLIRKGEENSARPPRLVDLRYPYGLMCLLSAGAANRPGSGFYIGAILLTAWGILRFRSGRYPAALWLALLLAAGLMGHGGAGALNRFQAFLEQKGLEWFGGMDGEPDVNRNLTAIGEIGALKFSGRIRFRVKGPPPEAGPFLLREAGYNIFRYNMWYAYKSDFKPLRADPDDPEAWNLTSAPPDPGGAELGGAEPGGAASGGAASAEAPAGPAEGWLKVIMPVRERVGLLKLPMGARRVENLPADRLERNPYGAARVIGAPGLIAPVIRFGPGSAFADPPVVQDHTLPDRGLEVIYEIVARLNLIGKEPAAVFREVMAYFRREYTYTLGGGPIQRADGLADFLELNHAGHCEYFASATTLLLRAAGIPARYAVGYMVDEYSRLEGCFLVRDRHAHSWAQAWVDGRWVDVDTTPPDWMAAEAGEGGWLRGMADLWEWLSFRVSLLKWRRDLRKHLAWLLIPLVLALVKRFVGRRGPRRITRDGAEKAADPMALGGMDSEFFEVIARLAAAGWGPRPGEALSGWLNRLAADGPPSLDVGPLRPLLGLHNRYRFDPSGIGPAERRELAAGARRWVAAASDAPFGPGGDPAADAAAGPGADAVTGPITGPIAGPIAGPTESESRPAADRPGR